MKINQLFHLKKKYTLTTLDEHCIGNSVSCLRRMPNSEYLDKKTFEPTGRRCIQISVKDLLERDMDDIMELSTGDYKCKRPERKDRFIWISYRIVTIFVINEMLH